MPEEAEAKTAEQRKEIDHEPHNLEVQAIALIGRIFMNTELYEQYKAMGDAEENVIFGGRFGSYKYYDMDQVIVTAIVQAQELMNMEK